MQNPVAIPFFFFSAWLAMVFWGMMAPEFGLPTISYLRAMLVTVAIWLVVGPLTWGKPGAKRSWGAGRRYRGKWKQANQTTSGNRLDISASFGETNRRVTSKEFIGGTVSVNFGSAKLDLRDAVIVEKPAVLEVRASFGEVEIVLPREWSVEFDIAANLAGVTDGRTGPTAEGPPDLVLTGSVLLGNIAVYD